MKTLLIYYHPVIWDLAKTFIELGHQVTVAVNPAITDNYGYGGDIIQRAEKKYGKLFKTIPLQVAARNIKNYNLVGCDGVFDGDKVIMEVCDKEQIPRFCIQGYPNVVDEPSQNIISFGWFMPTVQYHQKYISEKDKKELDWKNIAENTPEGKNICIFYPNFWDFKDEIDVVYDVNIQQNGFVSLIQGYEKWNKWSFEAFKKLKNEVRVENLEGIDHKEAMNRLRASEGLIHLKWADQPGIALIEAMLMGKPILTLKSFVLASMNQEVLIDNYNAVVADNLEELVYWSKQHEFLAVLGENAKQHANMLTNFTRQQMKLEAFIERCLR